MGESQKVFEQFFTRLKRRRMLKRTFGFLRWLVYTLLFLILLSWVLLQFPAVQNYLIQKITTYLSTELNTEVYIKRIDIDFFDKLVLEEFYLEDQQGDTLLYSKELKVDFKTNL
ncbi:MAG: autotransporter translocation and assembly factor TamB, partial [Saprospiraceae bacterium]